MTEKVGQTSRPELPDPVMLLHPHHEVEWVRLRALSPTGRTRAGKMPGSVRKPVVPGLGLKIRLFSRKHGPSSPSVAPGRDFPPMTDEQLHSGPSVRMTSRPLIFASPNGDSSYSATGAPSKPLLKEIAWQRAAGSIRILSNG